MDSILRNIRLNNVFHVNTYTEGFLWLNRGEEICKYKSIIHVCPLNIGMIDKDIDGKYYVERRVDASADIINDFDLDIGEPNKITMQLVLKRYSNWS